MHEPAPAILDTVLVRLRATTVVATIEAYLGMTGAQSETETTDGLHDETILPEHGCQRTSKILIRENRLGTDREVHIVSEKEIETMQQEIAIERCGK